MSYDAPVSTSHFSTLWSRSASANAGARTMQPSGVSVSSQMVSANGLKRLCRGTDAAGAVGSDKAAARSAASGMHASGPSPAQCSQMSQDFWVKPFGFISRGLLYPQR